MKREVEDAQQPLDSDGYTNDAFDKVYGRKKNPYTGTERDRGIGRNSRTFSIHISQEKADVIWGKKKNRGK